MDRKIGYCRGDMDDRQEEAYADGIDEACRSVACGKCDFHEWIALEECSPEAFAALEKKS